MPPRSPEDHSPTNPPEYPRPMAASPAEDYQWPDHVLPPIGPHKSGTDKARRALIQTLNQKLSETFGARAYILPSARAAIALALRLHGASRKDIAFAPQWSSHCVWDVLGRFANPTCQLTTAIHIALPVHRYAVCEQTEQSANLIIEDSCDTLPQAGLSLFPNGGAYEIISLPKIMGVYGGGIILTAQDTHQDEILNAQMTFADINLHQGKLRYQKADGTLSPYEDWSRLEYQNFAADESLLTTINDRWSALDKNAETIKRRLQKIKDIWPKLLAQTKPLSPGRLPPCLPVFCPAESKQPATELAPDVMVRMINWNSSAKTPDFRKAAILPLHFGVTDTQFDDLATQIAKVI